MTDTTITKLTIKEVEETIEKANLRKDLHSMMLGRSLLDVMRENERLKKIAIYATHLNHCASLREWEVAPCSCGLKELISSKHRLDSE